VRVRAHFLCVGFFVYVFVFVCACACARVGVCVGGGVVFFPCEFWFCLNHTLFRLGESLNFSAHFP